MKGKNRVTSCSFNILRPGREREKKDLFINVHVNMYDFRTPIKLGLNKNSNHLDTATTLFSEFTH